MEVLSLPHVYFFHVSLVYVRVYLQTWRVGKHYLHGLIWGVKLSAEECLNLWRRHGYTGDTSEVGCRERRPLEEK